MQHLRNFAISTAIPRVITGRCLSTTTALNMPIKAGDKLPEVDLYENNPGEKVNTKELFGAGKSVIFAVPGAFTPTCSQTHAPGFINDAAKLKEKGVKEVVCVSVNDPFVMAAWGKDLKADGKVRMLADTTAAFTKKLDLEMDLSGPLGSIRSKRYAMVVEDGVVKALSVEPDGTGMTCSAAADVFKML